jgi:hypothetical protein
MRVWAAGAVISAALVMSACTGGGSDAGSVGCTYMGNQTNAGVTAGEYRNIDAVADRDLSSSAELSSVGSAFISTGGVRSDGGTNAGAFITPPAGASSSEMTLNTYFNNAPVDSATGPALTITKVSGPAAEYVSLSTELPFDKVELIVAGTHGSSYLIYEFCGAANVQ